MSSISRPKQLLGWDSPCHRLHLNFLRYSCRKLRFVLPFSFVNLSFATDQLLSACWVWTPVTRSTKLSEWFTVCLDSPVSRPFICMNQHDQRAWLHVSLNYRQKHSSISLSKKLQIWSSGFILGVKYSMFTSALSPLLLVLNANDPLLVHDIYLFFFGVRYGSFVSGVENGLGQYFFFAA